MRAGVRSSFGGTEVKVEAVSLVLVDVDGGDWVSKWLFWVMARVGTALVRAVSSVSFLLQMSL